MGVAGRFAGDGAKPEPLAGVEARRLQAAIVEKETLGLRVLDIELAIVSPGERVGNRAPGCLARESGAVEDGVVGGHGG
jgi:hypothetical protein